VKTFKAELDEYRASFKSIKGANEDLVRCNSQTLGCMFEVCSNGKRDGITVRQS
jgi:hypothetical protein